MKCRLGKLYNRVGVDHHQDSVEEAYSYLGNLLTYPKKACRHPAAIDNMQVWRKEKMKRRGGRLSWFTVVASGMGQRQRRTEDEK